MDSKFKSHRKLLKQVNYIVETHEKISSSSGNNFNIFKLLNLEYDEVKLHSKIIADLLNPFGTHKCNNLFLNLFLDQQKKKVKEHSVFQRKLEEFDVTRAYVRKEFYIGQVNLLNQEGGRIDVLIGDQKNHVLVIENKIFPNDQKFQLVRYKSGFSFAPIFYLTLFGDTPSLHSKGSLVEGEDYVCISYEHDILVWLEACIKNAVQYPFLRETIGQYIHLIKQLTNQTTNEQMKRDLIQLLTEDGSNIGSAIQISNELGNAKLHLLQIFGNELKNRIININNSKEYLRGTINSIKIEIDENFGEKFCPIMFLINDQETVFVQLSALNFCSDFYLEIFNEENNEGQSKELSNLKFYKQELKTFTKDWGKVENVEKNWWGDWVCRYRKMGNWLDNIGWQELADKNYNFIDIIAMDIMFLIDVVIKNLEDKKIK